MQTSVPCGAFVWRDKRGLKNYEATSTTKFTSAHFLPTSCMAFQFAAEPKEFGKKKHINFPFFHVQKINDV